MTKKKTFIQSPVVIVCLIFILCILLFQICISVQDFISVIQNESTTYVEWGVNQDRVPPISNLLVISGITNIQIARLFNSTIYLLMGLSYLVIALFMLLFSIQNRKVMHPFTNRVYKCIKLSVLIILCIPTFLFILKLVLLAMTQLNLEWTIVMKEQLLMLSELLFNIVIYVSLLYLWKSGMTLQQSYDETI